MISAGGVTFSQSRSLHNEVKATQTLADLHQPPQQQRMECLDKAVFSGDPELQRRLRRYHFDTNILGTEAATTEAQIRCYSPNSDVCSIGPFKRGRH